MQLKTNAEAHQVDKENYETFKREVENRWKYIHAEKTSEYAANDVLLNGKHVVEMKRRECPSWAYGNFFFSLSKMEELRELFPDSILLGVMFFTDKWFCFDLKQGFELKNKFVKNPIKGSRMEWQCVVYPSQGTWYDYTETPAWEK